MDVSMRAIPLNELANLVGGSLVFDDPAQCATGQAMEITNALPLQDAGPGCLTLADHPKHLKRVNHSTASAVMVREALPGCRLPMIVVGNLHVAFAQAIAVFRPARAKSDRDSVIHPSACVASSAHVGEHTSLASGVVIGENCQVGERCVLHSGVQLMDDCIVGDDCELFPHVTLYPDTRLGNRVLIHAGVVLGAYGFGYRTQDGHHVRSAQLGWVEVADDVEIGAATTIDRGTYGATRIGQGTKIDNQVQIGHNCHIGRHNLICAQVGIAGSSSTGDNVVLAGQVGIADHLQLADNVTVGAQSGIMNNVEAGQVVMGSPAGPGRQRMIEWALIGRLPEMRRELKALQAQLQQLSAAAAAPSETETTTLRRSA
ncbi:MAG: UDP-3-O-(3-hydroxymyristoyl)glucosamine N-acyltransferase [Pirellulaceae bacterium]